MPDQSQWANAREPAAAKVERRQEVRSRLAALSASERLVQSRALLAGILGNVEWRAAGRVLLFVPLPDEIDLWPLIPAALAEGKRVGLPAFDPGTGTYVVKEVKSPEHDLVPGRFRIPEPGPLCRLMPVEQLDVALVPGLAFDAAGGRLGRGRGFYDRLLARAGGRWWGVGFDEQLGPPVPREPWDVQLHRILTPASLTGSGVAAG